MYDCSGCWRTTPGDGVGTRMCSHLTHHVYNLRPGLLLVWPYGSLGLLTFLRLGRQRVSPEAKPGEAVVRLHLSWGLRGPGPESRLKASALGWHSPPGGSQERRGRADLWPFLSLWALGPPPKEEPRQSAMLVSGWMAEEACSPGFWGWEAFQNSPPAARAVPFCKQMAPSLLHLILLPVPCSSHCAWLFAVGRPGALQCPPCPCRAPGLAVLVNSPACSGSPHLFLHQLCPGALAP